MADDVAKQDQDDEYMDALAMDILMSEGPFDLILDEDGNPVPFEDLEDLEDLLGNVPE